MILRMQIPSAGNPATPYFWFVMSIGLLIGFIFAYPINWWLVANHLKHGMMTVRPAGEVAGAGGHVAHAATDRMQDAGGPPMSMAMDSSKPTRPPIPVMTLLSFIALAAGWTIAFLV
jgi:hypothetical protein